MRMAETSVMNSSCEDFESVLHCSIDTHLDNCDFAFYIDINGERKETRWYSKDRMMKYEFGEEIVHYYKVSFFVREEDGTIHREICEQKTHWSYCDGVLSAVKLLIDESCTILEFGSGYGSQKLSSYCTIFSVEHDDRFISLFPEVNYIHAPLMPSESFQEFCENQWYDADVVSSSLPERIDLILVDGPPNEIGRSGLLHHLELFPDDVVWIIDDVLRSKDQQLANYICLHKSLIQYRFWNFSILTKKPIHSNIIQSIHTASEIVFNNESSNYLRHYYPSLK